MWLTCTRSNIQGLCLESNDPISSFQPLPNFVLKVSIISLSSIVTYLIASFESSNIPLTPYLLNHLIISSSKLDERILLLLVFCTLHPMILVWAIYYQTYSLLFVIYLHSLCMVSTSKGRSLVSNSMIGQDVEDFIPNSLYKNNSWIFSISFNA